MGTVWRARDSVLHREVALKEVRPPDPAVAAAMPEASLVLRERVLREARALASINHPHVVTIHHIVDAGPHPWIVMELLPGRTLQDRLSQGVLAPEEAARIGRQVLSALRAAHAVGIQHRDVKPANVMLRADGGAVLTDFGIAALQGSTPLTMTGDLIGSPEYIAPERIRGHDGDPASDLWSLGVVLYVCVEGEPAASRYGPGHARRRAGRPGPATRTVRAARARAQRPAGTRPGFPARCRPAGSDAVPGRVGQHARPGARGDDADRADRAGGSGGLPTTRRPRCCRRVRVRRPSATRCSRPVRDPGVHQAAVRRARAQPYAGDRRCCRRGGCTRRRDRAGPHVQGRFRYDGGQGDRWRAAGASPTASSASPAPSRQSTPPPTSEASATTGAAPTSEAAPPPTEEADDDHEDDDDDATPGGALSGSWVAQLASTEKSAGPGARDRQENALRNKGIDNIQFLDSDAHASLKPGYWMFYVPGFGSGSDAVTWCRSHGLSTNNTCVGRYLSDNANDRQYLCSPAPGGGTSGRCTRS
ncbi:protein kinase [Streptomyces sp. M10(2022)]